MLRATLQCAGDKYKVLMREDPEAEEQDARGGPRIAFEVMPTAVVQSPEPPGWQRIAAGALLLFTAATTLQIGLAANVSRLPKVLLWLWPCCSSLSWIPLRCCVHYASVYADSAASVYSQSNRHLT